MRLTADAYAISRPRLEQNFAFLYITHKASIVLGMLTFLFWNLKEMDVPDIVAALAHEHDVDVLMLAENSLNPAALLRHLNPPGTARYSFSPSVLKTPIDIFFGQPAQFIKPFADEGRASIRRIDLPGRQELLLCAVHMQSSMYWSDKDQASAAAELNDFIREHERQAGHCRTVVVGDLNMNPFSHGVVSADGFNAVMTHDVALRGSRRLNGRTHPFFFNPMWAHFSDGTRLPAGTFFYNPPGYTSVYWHMLDQVLIRPPLIPQFDSSSLRILHAYSGRTLVGNNGRPNVSDHLPIVFKLNL